MWHIGRFSVFKQVNGGSLVPVCGVNKSFLAYLKRNVFSKSVEMIELVDPIINRPLRPNRTSFFVPVAQLKHFTTQKFVLMGHGTRYNCTCWNCGKNSPSSYLFCESCKSLLPLNKTEDFFQILGVDRSYSCDISDLRQKFRKLQTLLHPDKFSSKSKKEQELSEEFSSVVNKAFSTLSNPMERGLYLLSLHNMSIEEENTDLDKAFLMEIMERNEEIENESDPQKLNVLSLKNKEKLSLLTKNVGEAFESKDLTQAKKLLTEMKYYNSIDTKIKEVKQNLNIPD